MTDASNADAIVPDDKDWTWVLDRPCPECGFDAAAVAQGSVGVRVRSALPAYRAALAAPDARRRPDPATWSALEYGCHVRDVFRIFHERLTLMLREDDPVFADWDQDVTAREDRYDLQDPEMVSADLTEAGERIAAAWDAVHDDQWDRPARRSNGSVFTVGSFSRYFLHDVEHHLHDLHLPSS
ncbi:MAG: DinB family protein [Pseudonocardia sp.]|uniref:DinB family protein n=1 Tax=unclassified Pseudonocardia TaxID=2619320 RepID=UPI00086A61BB|nr:MULTISPECIES: DinB family protein [unclassified Pseudonocardia]MBN9113280.1 DinB family protein [Pseudonocardia sp.]ODU19844.1 MAG: methyltransferase type 12 [Pseudonocardia sp. SCN 72-51]ODV00871.1 MAG: methyltransferase type 12 [Pseudonocardia sp. SCN 73-27]